jgi:hypothetical protein
MPDGQSFRHRFLRVLARQSARRRTPSRTREWLEAFDALIASEGRERATFLLRKLLDHARVRRVPLPPVLNTPYKNSIELAQQPHFPGNLELEQRISSIVRWNALAMVVRANRRLPELGGPYRELRLGGGSLRGGLQPLLPRRAARRSGVLPAPFRALACMRGPSWKAVFPKTI